MRRITVEVSDETYDYIESAKKSKGVSISFQANQLIEQSIKERNRKKKRDAEKDNTTNNPTN